MSARLAVTFAASMLQRTVVVCRLWLCCGVPLALVLSLLTASGASAPVASTQGHDSPCHHEMVKLCNSTAGKGAPCLACEQHNQAALANAGCTGGGGSKLSRFCGGAPSPPAPRPGPSPPTPPHTADCPNGPDHPCTEPATPKIASGYVSSNLFWPGEQDAEGRVYTCTYCPMVTLVNNTRLVALGGCTPSGCPGCNGIHVSDVALRSSSIEGGDHATKDRAGSACGAACIKTSDDGGRTWTKIRRFADHGVGGMINYDRVTKEIIVHYPSRVNISTSSGVISAGSVVQITSPDAGETWSDPVDISKMLGPLFSPFFGSRGGLAVGPGAGNDQDFPRFILCQIVLVFTKTRCSNVQRTIVQCVDVAASTDAAQRSLPIQSRMCGGRFTAQCDEQIPPKSLNLRWTPRRISVRLRLVQ